MHDLTGRVRVSEQDAAAARVLAGAADRDVSEFRGEIGDFRRATAAGFNALREGFVDLRTHVDNGSPRCAGSLTSWPLDNNRLSTFFRPSSRTKGETDRHGSPLPSDRVMAKLETRVARIAEATLAGPTSTTCSMSGLDRDRLERNFGCDPTTERLKDSDQYFDLLA